MARSRRLALAGLCLVLVGCQALTTDGVEPSRSAPPASPTGSLTGSPDPTPTPTASTPTAEPSPPACAVPAQLTGQELSRLPTRKRLVALTFDAGANADGLASIRATLRRMDVKATFFLTGRFVAEYPVKSRRLAARDLVGNHTMTHADLTTLSDGEIAQEVRSAEEVILETTGEDPRRFFRFPLGARDDLSVAVVNELCYVPFRWTVDTLGWQGTSGGQSVASVVSRVVGAATPGAIVLMHVGSNPDDATTLDADALPEIIRRLRALDYRFVRLSRLLDPLP